MTLPAPEPAKFTIDYGDGSMPVPNVLANIEQEHDYPAHGTYTVKVTNDASGRSSTRQVTVGDPQAAPEFTAVPTGAARQVRVVATYPDTETFTINYGDGSAPVTGVNPGDEQLYTYTQRGTYTVTVTAVASGKSSTRTVTVEDPDAAPEFTVTATGQPRQARLIITYPV